MSKKYINEQQLTQLISEKVVKYLKESFYGNENFYTESENDGRLSDMESESEEEQETRDSIEAFFKQDGVNSAAYAYSLYNVKAVEGEDTDEMKNARSKFAKCLNHEQNEAGYPYSFTSAELNTLKGMISSNQLNERINKAINESFKNLKKKLNEDIEDDDFNVDDLDWETQQELNYDLHQFNKAAQQANGTYQATSQDGSLKTGDRVAFQTVNGLIDGIIVDFDINPMTGEETADVDYWRRDKAAKWTMLSIPLSKIQKL